MKSPPFFSSLHAERRCPLRIKRTGAHCSCSQVSTRTASPDVHLQLVLNSKGRETEGDSWTGRKALPPQRLVKPRRQKCDVQTLNALKEINGEIRENL